MQRLLSLLSRYMFLNCACWYMFLFAGSTGLLDREYLRHLDSGATSCNATDHQAETMHDHQCTSGQPENSVSPILELVLQGKPIAVALKQHSQPVSPLAHAPSTSSSHSIRQQAHIWQPASQGAHCNGKSAEPWTCIYAMDGSVLATEQEGNVYKGGDTGRHTHTILTGQTPLVRHLHIVSSGQGTGRLTTICQWLYAISCCYPVVHHIYAALFTASYARVCLFACLHAL